MGRTLFLQVFTSCSKKLLKIEPFSENSLHEGLNSDDKSFCGKGPHDLLNRNQPTDLATDRIIFSERSLWACN